MIGNLLNSIKEMLNASITGVNGQAIVIGNISQIENLSGDNTVLLSLVNIEQDTPLRNNPNYTRVSDTEVVFHNPKMVLNLYVLFALGQVEETGDSGLNILTQIIAFFQKENVFTRSDLTPHGFMINENSSLQTEKVIFDLYSMSFEQLNHLWGMLGGKYLPSVLYKVRLVTVFVDENKEPESVIRSIEREEEIIN